MMYPRFMNFVMDWILFMLYWTLEINECIWWLSSIVCRDNWHWGALWIKIRKRMFKVWCFSVPMMSHPSFIQIQKGKLWCDALPHLAEVISSILMKLSMSRVATSEPMNPRPCFLPSQPHFSHCYTFLICCFYLFWKYKTICHQNCQSLGRTSALGVLGTQETIYIFIVGLPGRGILSSYNTPRIYKA